MFMKRKYAQTMMFSILYLLVIFTFISVAYSWFSVNESALASGSSIQVVNDYDIGVNWYDDEGKMIDSEFVEYLDNYDKVNTRYVSMENLGALDVYGFMSFDTTSMSYELFLSRFSYKITEISAVNNSGLGRILKGEGIPLSTDGTLNHFYINTLNNDFYKKTSSGWQLFNATVAAVKPSTAGSEGDYYLYNSSNYPTLYEFTNSEWIVRAYDDNATPLNLYITENISIGTETPGSSGDLADFAKLLIGDSVTPGVGIYLKGVSGYNTRDGGTKFWRFDYTVLTSTATSPNQGAQKSLFIKPRIHITFGEIYTIDPVEGPIWMVNDSSELIAALHETTGAADRHTIRLNNNILYTGDLTIFNSITLDLNGHDLTVSGNLTYQASPIYNSVFLHIPNGSDLTVVNLNINTNTDGRIYIDMGDGGKTVVSNNINITAPNLNIAFLGDNSVSQLTMSNINGLINVDVNYDDADEQRLISTKGLIFNNLKTNSAPIVVTRKPGGNASRIYISEHSLVGTITAESVSGTSNVSMVQIVNLGSVGYIDLSGVALGMGDYFVDVYFGGTSTAAGNNKLKVPSGATVNNTYVEVSSLVDIITTDVSGMTGYIRVYNNVVTNVTSLNEFVVIGSANFTNDEISRPYYWVRFDLTVDRVVQVLKYGTIASLFSNPLYNFEPIDTTTTYFDGWIDEEAHEFVRNQAVIRDIVLTDLILDVNYTVDYELDSGVIDKHPNKQAMVDDFLADYIAFYNIHKNDDGKIPARPDISVIDLKDLLDTGYEPSSALIARMDVKGCTPYDFFHDDAFRSKWLWTAEYIMSLRTAFGLGNDSFDRLLNKSLDYNRDDDPEFYEETQIDHSVVKYEVWAFLADRSHSETYFDTIDYTNYSNAYDYVFFPSYPFRYSSKAFAQGGTSFTLVLPEPQKRGTYTIGGGTYGYIFGGWYEDAAYTTLLGDPGDTVTYTKLTSLLSGTSVKIYAKWIPGVAKVVFTDKTETYYNSIEEAITAANLNVGSSVYLLMNTSLNSARTTTGITVDLGIYYLTVNANFTMTNGDLKGSRAFLIAGTNGAKLVINDLVTIEPGVNPWSIAGNPINQFVIGGLQITDIDFTASNHDWTTNKRQVLFMHWADGDLTNAVSSDLVLKIKSIDVVNIGAYSSAPAEPAMTGWTFMGWNEYSGGSLITTNGGYLYVGASVSKAASAFDFANSPINNSTVLVAWFKATVGYSIEGAVADATNDVYFGETSHVRIVDTLIKKTGYRLVGWTYIFSGTGEEFYCNVPYTYQYFLPYNAILVADWMPIEYTVIFDSNGGSGLMNPNYQDFKYNVSQTIHGNSFEKDGYVFSSWNTKATGTGGKSYSNLAAIFESNSVTLDHGVTVVLYARWTIATYEITFYDKAGAGAATKTQNLTYLSVAPLTANTFTKQGYSFIGWSMNPAAVYIDFYNNYDLSDSELIVLVNSGAKLYAVWNEMLYVGSWTVGGVEQKFGVFKTGTTVSVTTTKTGYTFSGWYDNPAFSGTKKSDASSFTMYSDINYFAKLELIVYNITYNTDPVWTWTTGTVTPANGIDSASNLPEIFMQDFYQYLYANQYLTSPLVSQQKTYWSVFKTLQTDPKACYNRTNAGGSVGNADAYNQFFWTSISGSNATGGFFGTEPYKTKYVNLLIHLTNMFPLKYSGSMNTAEGKALTGFILDGYFYGTQGEGSGSFLALRKTIPNTNLKWNTTGTTSSSTTYQVTTYTVETATITLRAPVREGYLFEGWYTNSNFTGSPVTTINKGSTGNKTFYARWVTIYSRTYVLAKRYANTGVSPNEITIGTTGPPNQYWYTIGMKVSSSTHKTWEIVGKGIGITSISGATLYISYHDSTPAGDPLTRIKDMYANTPVGTKVAITTAFPALGTNTNIDTYWYVMP